MHGSENNVWIGHNSCETTDYVRMQNTSHEQKKMMLGSIVVNQKQKCETTVDTGSLRHSKQTVRSNSVSAEAEENLASTAWIHGPNLACVNSCCSHSVYFKGQSLFEYCSWPCASSKGCLQYDDVSCLKWLLWTWQRVKWTSVASVSDSSLSQLLWDVVTQQ